MPFPPIIRTGACPPLQSLPLLPRRPLQQLHFPYSNGQVFTHRQLHRSILPWKHSLGRPTATLIKVDSSSSRTTTAFTTATTVTRSASSLAGGGSRSPLRRRFRNFLISTTILAVLTGGYILLTDTRSSVHTYVIPPLLRVLFPSPSGAEAAHSFGVKALSKAYTLNVPLRDRSYGVPQWAKIPLTPQGSVDWIQLSQTRFTNPFGLSIHLFGHPLTSPLGIPAGLDKHAEAVDALFAISPAVAILEIGCVTPKPQPGNSGVRVWRLPSSETLLNRYGFNSIGSVEVARRLRERVRRFAVEYGVSGEEVLDGLLPVHDGSATTSVNEPLQRPLPASLIPGRLLAIQIGKNASTPTEDLSAVIADYVYCVDTLGPYADLLVVNVSSPNTPGLRTLQSRRPLTQLLTAVVSAADKLPRRVKPKVLVKVSPDEDGSEQVRDICAAVRDSGVSGVIVANTTMRRDNTLFPTPPSPSSEQEVQVLRNEAGGVSGPVLYKPMLALVAQYRRELDALGLWERFEAVENGGPGTVHEGGEQEQHVDQALQSYWGTARRLPGSGVVIIGCGGVRTGEQAAEVMRRGAGTVGLYTGMVYGGVGTLGRVAREMRKIVRGE